MAKVTGVQRATGRERAEWFELLDAWGAVGRPYREISDWLTGEHGLSRRWAQKLIVEYEQERGMVSHDRITGAKQAQRVKAGWKERLVKLKSYLES